MANTGYDNSELQNLSYAQKLKEAEAVEHNLLIRLAAPATTTAEGKTLTRNLQLIQAQVKELRQLADQECSCLPNVIEIQTRN